MSEKAAARKYPTYLDIHGCRELGLSEAKGKFTFALKRELFLYFLPDKKVNKESDLNINSLTFLDARKVTKEHLLKNNC